MIEREHGGKSPLQPEVLRERLLLQLEHTSLEIVGKNISDKEEFELLVKKTSQSCSIFQTISKVSAMDIVVRFEDDEE